MWMLVCLMLSQRSLKLSSFLFTLFSFFCSVSVISTTLSSSLPNCFSHIIYCWFFLMYFYLIYCVLDLCLVLLYIFSLLKTSNFSLCSFILLLSSLNIFMIITLNSLLGRLPVSTSLSSSSRIYIFSSFGTYSSVALFCRICCFYFYVFGKLVVFPDLWEVAFCRRCPMCPSITHPLVTQAVCSREAPSVSCVGPSVLVGSLL